LDPQIVERIDSIDPVDFRGRAYRHVSLTRSPISGDGARVHGGRWNPPGSFPTLYLALDRPTMLAELKRTARRFGIPPEGLLPRAVYRCDIALHSCLDLREESSLKSASLSLNAIRSDNRRRCQEVAMAAHYLGLEGLLAPSATGAGFTIAIFTDRLGPDSSVDPGDAEIWNAIPNHST